MRIFLLIILLNLRMLTLHSQKGISGLIEAEKNFAAYSVAHSTKDAFLKFLDSTGIVFNEGKAVNGIQLWSNREKKPGILNWQPVYAEISSSGDFGYTSGPWTYQSSVNDSIVARGIYTTVWHINKNGEWKFLIDLGTSSVPIYQNQEDGKIIMVKKNTDSLKRKTGFIKAERSFIKLAGTDKVKAYKKYQSSQYSILTRNGHFPATKSAAQKSIIDSTPSTIIYQLDGWRVSQANDLAYTYGTAESNGLQENYLRIWRNEEKQGWKIALEVLLY